MSGSRRAESAPGVSARRPEEVSGGVGFRGTRGGRNGTAPALGPVFLGVRERARVSPRTRPHDRRRQAGTAPPRPSVQRSDRAATPRLTFTETPHLPTRMARDGARCTTFGPTIRQADATKGLAPAGRVVSLAHESPTSLKEGSSWNSRPSYPTEPNSSWCSPTTATSCDASAREHRGREQNAAPVRFLPENSPDRQVSSRARRDAYSLRSVCQADDREGASRQRSRSDGRGGEP